MNVIDNLVSAYNKASHNFSTPEESTLFEKFAQDIDRMSNGTTNVNFESQGRTVITYGNLGSYQDNHGTYGSDDAETTLNVAILRNSDEAAIRLGSPNQPLTEESLRPYVVTALMESGYSDIATSKGFLLNNITGYKDLSGVDKMSLKNADVRVQGIEQWRDTAQKLVEGKLDGVSGIELLEQNPEGLIDPQSIKGTYSVKGGYEEIKSLYDVRDPSNAGLGYESMIEYAQDKIIAEEYNELIEDMIKSKEYENMSSDEIIQNTFNLHQQAVADVSNNNLAYKAYKELGAQIDNLSIEDSAVEEGLKQAAKLYYDEHPEQQPQDQSQVLSTDEVAFTNKM